MKTFLKLSLMCAAAGASVLAMPQAAEACGGFFCDASQPVNQAAERIVFVKDGEDSFRAIVGIAYEGDADSFAWVLPVEGVPEIGVSSTEFLNELQNATDPSFRVRWTFECDQELGAAPGSFSDGGALMLDAGSSVNVVSSGVTGPYDYRVLEVSGDPEERANTAVEWLQESGFDIDDAGNATLQPYLASGMNLLAIRLTKGAESGDVRPLAIDFPGPVVGIPLRPTAVAAVSDMPVMVWVAGPSRAVGNNFLALEPNYALLNWLNPLSNYNEVVNAAADAAGGQGFVTEFAGSMIPEQSNFPEPDASADIRSLIFGYASSPLLVEVMADHLPEGLSEEELRGCVGCVAGTFEPPDPEAFRAQLRRDIYEPYTEAWELLQGQPYLTRLFTTLSPAEMDRDPTFVFNDTLGDVSNVHQAEGTRSCENDDFTVTIDGVTVRGTGNTWPIAIDDPSMPATAEIRRVNGDGEGMVLEDNRELIRNRLQARFPAPAPGTSGADDSGCSAGGSGGGGLALLFVLGLLRRRRR